MSCICKRCGKPMNECEFTVCVRCYLEMTDDEAKKNLMTGGRFYPPKKEPKK